MNFKAQKIFSLFVCFYILAIFNASSSIVPIDSVGVEKRGDKTFVLHKVDPKETLYSISQRYKTKVELIEAENPEVKSGLKIGAVILVPYTAKPVSTAAVSKISTSNSTTHIVTAGQTLYSISRLYNARVEDIKKWNNISNNEISVGQEIFVTDPSTTATPVVERPKEEHLVEIKEVSKELPNLKYDSKGNKVHVTEPGQTLYSLARIYEVKVDDLMKWNNLTKYEISSGQELIVEKPKQNEEQLSREIAKEDSNRQEPVKVASTTPEPVKIEPAAKTEQPKSTPNPGVEPEKPSNPANFNKISARGLAELIEGSEDNPKFLALHKSASVGTIIQVKNELNNLYIFARVIGKLPETTSNDKLLIKLSKKAYDKLGAVDKRFPVEVSYVPNN